MDYDKPNLGRNFDMVIDQDMKSLNSLNKLLEKRK